MAEDPLAKTWADAKAAFQSITGKSKPKESKGIFNAFGSFTGLSGALDKFDKACTAASKTNQVKKADLDAGNKLVDEMTTALASFKKARTSYATVLTKTIDKEIDKRTELKVKTEYERALKYLNTQLTAIEDTGAARVKSYRQRFDVAEKDQGLKDKMLLNWSKNIEGALSRGVAAVAKVKAKPTVELYNKAFPTAARDITMQLVFAKDLDGFKADPEILLKAMKPWGEQSGHPPATLAKTATKDEVLKQLGDFNKELKRVQQLVATRG